MLDFLDIPWYIPPLIYCARVCDVSIGSFRTILMLSGFNKWLVGALGVVEVTIWIYAVGGVVSYLPNPLAVAGYATGYGSGVVLGTWIEERVALGLRMVRVVASPEELDLPGELRARNYVVTHLKGHGRDSEVDVAFIVVKRRNLHRLLLAIREIAPKAFVTVERVDRASGAAFGPRPAGKRRFAAAIGLLRK